MIGVQSDEIPAGSDLPVASIEDVLQGKIWAASSAERRPTIPAEILEKLG